MSSGGIVLNLRGNALLGTCAKQVTSRRNTYWRSHIELGGAELKRALEGGNRSRFDLPGRLLPRLAARASLDFRSDFHGYFVLKSLHGESLHRDLRRPRRPGRYQSCPGIEIEQLGAKRSGRKEVAIPQSGEKLWKFVQPAHDLVSLERNRRINNSAVHCRSPFLLFRVPTLKSPILGHRLASILLGLSDVSSLQIRFGLHLGSFPFCDWAAGQF